jgi:hypothetical protein
MKEWWVESTKKCNRGYGFSIIKTTGAECVTLVFETRNEAERYEGIAREMVSLATTI